MNTHWFLPCVYHTWIDVLNVLIAEDEQVVSQLLIMLIEWKELNLNLVAQAGDGISALKLIQEKQPDIVITDIKMPGLDGLEVIEHVRNNNKSVRFLVISGHKNFDYARQALKFGVDDYLLKPIEKSELNQTLAKISSEIISKRKSSEENENLRFQLTESLDKLRAQFIPEFIAGKRLGTLEEYREQYKMNFMNGYFCILVACADENNSNYCTLLERIKDTILALFGDCCCDMSCTVIGRKLYGLIHYIPERMKEIDDRFSMLEAEINRKSAFTDLRVNLGIGIQVNDISLLERSLKSSQNGLAQRLYLGVGRCIKSSNWKTDDKIVESMLPENWEKTLLNVAEFCDSQALDILAKQILDKIGNKSVSSNEIIMGAERMIRYFVKCIEKNEDNYIEPCKIFEMIDEISTRNTVEGVIQSIKKQILLLLQPIISKNELMLTRPIREVKKHISQNFNQDLTLDFMAQMVHLNSAYLSTVFKKETGMNISQYIIKCRIEAAKEMLTHFDNTIDMIGKKVGYKDPKHFRNIFIKEVGISPSEYRKLHI